MSLLIKSATPPNLASQHWVATEDTGIYLGDGLAPTPAGATVIASNGVVQSLSEYLAIRPLGNASGQATPQLLYQHFMGEPQLAAGDPVAVDPIVKAYPTDNRPFAIEVRHKLFIGNTNPAWDGWGWRAEIMGGASSRDPSARAIGIYTDEACTQYRYTTGAFTQQQSAWQLDANGQPLTVWATEYNPGLLGDNNDAKANVYHACLLGAVQEGHATLHATDERAYHEFWLHDQGYVAPPSATWIDTGATITAQFGTAYQLSAVLTGLSIGQPLRLGLTVETTFNGYWPTVGTPSDNILLNPFKQVAVGSKVYKWA